MAGEIITELIDYGFQIELVLADSLFREIIYGKKGAVTYWEITTDPETMPPNSTSFVKTNLKGKLKKIVGNLYGLRTWVEYGFRQCKQELGWTEPCPYSRRAVFHPIENCYIKTLAIGYYRKQPKVQFVTV